jgi:hypothetical protein
MGPQRLGYSTACLSICGYARTVAMGAAQFVAERIPKVKVSQPHPDGE